MDVSIVLGALGVSTTENLATVAVDNFKATQSVSQKSVSTLAPPKPSSVSSPFSPPRPSAVGGVLNPGGMTQEEIEEFLRSYPVGKCKEAAEALSAELTRRGQRHEVITIWYPNNPILVSMIRGIWISDNGEHMGVFYNNRVHCNIHPYGLELRIWLNDFVTIRRYPFDATVTPARYQDFKTRQSTICPVGL